MKHRIFFMLYLMLIATFIFKGFASEKEIGSVKKQIYEWRIYTLTGDGTGLDTFFKETLIPAYNRYKVSVGAFAPYKKEEKEQRYLLFVYPDLQTYYKVKQAVCTDKDYLRSARPFFEATAPNPVYSDYETYLCEAFDKIPVMRMPDKNRTLFEFRLYHSPNEDANFRKIKMFNTDEIDLFDKVGIHSVCYGEILAGMYMPALIYLTWHKDEPTRNDVWKAFSAHPDWNRMKNDPEYKYTATNNQVRLLSPMPYSQF
ncbi:MAG: NIPSNAP family protein [Dysgonamonadaceae bacterium]|nr:NIPSNAP family protein [Dysgonamonadaceae bacterium]